MSDVLLCSVCGIPFTTLSGNVPGCPVHGIRKGIRAEAVPDLLATCRGLINGMPMLRVANMAIAAVTKAKGNLP